MNGLLSKLRTKTQPPAFITGWPAGLTGQALGAEVIDYVRAHPEEHDQRRVAYGNTACLAGWTIALHYGVRPANLHGMRHAHADAAQLLGLDTSLFATHVFSEMNETKAIHRLKSLIDA